MRKMLESPVHVIRGGQDACRGLEVSQQNIKNKLAASPELSSSAEELAAAQSAWEAVQCVEPVTGVGIGSSTHRGTDSTDTVDKKPVAPCTPSQSSTPSIIGTASNTKSRSSATHCSSSRHSLQDQYEEPLEDQFQLITLQDGTDSKYEQHVTRPSWSPHHKRYPPQPDGPVMQCQRDLPVHGLPFVHHPRQPLPSPLNGSLANLGPRVTPTIDFEEAWQYFLRQDMSHVKGSIRPTVEKRGVPGLLRGLFGPRRLKPDLVPERDLVFCIAQCPLSNSEPLHLQMLQTIYRALTGTRTDCPRYGPHWDIIGFQGSDPSTDLRGVGLLGLVQMVALVGGEQSQHLAADVFALSHDQHSQFPLMVLCLNVTRIALQALREGCLNKSEPLLLRCMLFL
ncbi:ELMO domain [Trinorchestia longiramus]|nr:ELMO domain [Trinorchestia longiramus]